MVGPVGVPNWVERQVSRSSFSLAWLGWGILLDQGRHGTGAAAGQPEASDGDRSAACSKSIDDVSLYEAGDGESSPYDQPGEACIFWVEKWGSDWLSTQVEISLKVLLKQERSL
jgi:hypothetical protein